MSAQNNNLVEKVRMLTRSSVKASRGLNHSTFLRMYTMEYVVTASALF